MGSGDGYGKQQPTDATSKRNATLFTISQEIAKLDTVKIVQVKAVDTGSKTVDVMPLVRQTDGNDQVTDQITVYGVPYMQWQYGVNALLADPAVDDIGVLLCSDRDITAVKSTKAPAPPGSDRAYDRADGIYLGGLLNGDPEQSIEFTDSGIEISDKNSNVMLFGASGISINGVVFNQSGQIAGALPVTGNLELGGGIKALDGSGYTADISTSGRFHGTDFQIGSGGTLISLLGHWHAAFNAPPVPGH